MIAGAMRSSRPRSSEFVRPFSARKWRGLDRPVSAWRRRLFVRGPDDRRFLKKCRHEGSFNPFSGQHESGSGHARMPFKSIVYTVISDACQPCFALLLLLRANFRASAPSVWYRSSPARYE